MGRLGWHMMQNDTNIGAGPDEWEDGIDPGSPHLGDLAAVTPAAITNLWAQWRALRDAGATTKYAATMTFISTLISSNKVTDAQSNINSVKNWMARDRAMTPTATNTAQGVIRGTSLLDNLSWKKILIGVAAAGLIWWAVKGRKGK